MLWLWCEATSVERVLVILKSIETVVAVPNEGDGLIGGEESHSDPSPNPSRLLIGEKRSLSDSTGRDLKISSPRFGSSHNDESSSKLTV